MQDINSTARLKEAIQLLEVDQAIKRKQLKEEFLLTYENLRPVNLLKSTLKEFTSSPDLINNFLGTAVGMTTGILTRKIYVGKSGNIFRNLLGSMLQFGVTNLVSSHPDTIRSFAQFIFQNFLRKKEPVSSHEESE